MSAFEGMTPLRTLRASLGHRTSESPSAVPTYALAIPLELLNAEAFRKQ